MMNFFPRRIQKIQLFLLPSRESQKVFFCNRISTLFAVTHEAQRSSVTDRQTNRSIDRPTDIVAVYRIVYAIYRNGGYRREEKSHKHWSFFTTLPFAVTANFFLFLRLNQEQLYVLNALKIREK